MKPLALSGLGQIATNAFPGFCSHFSSSSTMSLFRSTAVLATRGVRMMQARTYAEGAMKLTFAAANKVFYDQTEVKQIDVPSFSGDFGILASHVPTLGECSCGNIRRWHWVRKCTVVMFVVVVQGVSEVRSTYLPGLFSQISQSNLFAMTICLFSSYRV